MVSVKSPPCQNKINVWDVVLSQKCSNQDFKDKMLSHYVIHNVQQIMMHTSLRGDQLIKNSFWTVWALKMKVPWSFNTSGTNDLMTQNHIPNVWYPQIQNVLKEKCVIFIHLRGAEVVVKIVPYIRSMRCTCWVILAVGVVSVMAVQSTIVSTHSYPHSW